MDFIIKLAILVIVVILPSWLYQEQNLNWERTRVLLKNADNNAVHDASQWIDDVQKSRGKIIFDPVAARAGFEDTLRKNLGLDATLTPMVGSPLSKPVKIVFFQLIDETNATFPFLYTNSTYNITRWLNGPAVVAVVETDHPVFIQRLYVQGPVRVPAIQEYKENK